VNKKLFVGNIPYSTSSDQLREAFSSCGKILDCVVITDSHTGRSKGFGFVEFEKEEDAKKAIETFNGKDLGGRNIVVNEARPRNDGGNPRKGFKRR